MSTLQEDKRRLLEMSQREVRQMPESTIRCPVCSFRILEVYGEKKGWVRIKCRKCRFEGVMNLAYFRSQNNRE